MQYIHDGWNLHLAELAGVEFRVNYVHSCVRTSLGANWLFWYRSFHSFDHFRFAEGAVVMSMPVTLSV